MPCVPPFGGTYIDPITIPQPFRLLLILAVASLPTNLSLSILVPATDFLEKYQIRGNNTTSQLAVVARPDSVSFSTITLAPFV